MAKVNNRDYDFSDIQLRVEGKAPVAITIKAVAYKLNRTVGKLFANTPKKLKRTRGQLDPDGSIRIPRYQLDDLLDALAESSETGAYGDALFNVTVTYGTDNQETQTDVLEDCLLLDIDTSHESGVDGLELTLPLDILDISYNGKKMFNDPQ